MKGLQHSQADGRHSGSVRKLQLQPGPEHIHSLRGMPYSEEVLVFDFLDMVGNVGGYLGLFLGISILSIFDLATITVEKISAKGDEARRIT